MRVLVTRPQPQADQWVARLGALGVQASALPLLGIAQAPDDAAVQAAWAALPRYALVMFVSPNAVERFFARRPAGTAWPDGALAGSTGPGTAAALAAAGVPAGQIVTPPLEGGQFDAEALWGQLAHRRDWRGAQALIVRGEGGRDWLAETLRDAGAQVAFVAAYRRTAPVLDDAQAGLLREALAAPQAHCWHFSSSEAIGHLPALAPGQDWSAAQALATHPRIAETARRLGFGRVTQVEVTPEAVASCIARSIQSARP